MFDEIHNAAGEHLDATFHDDGLGEPNGRLLVVIGHGVTANKDRDWAVALSETLQSDGIASLRFSFSGNGSSGGDFRASCPTKEAVDLGSVLDACDGWQVIYVGHSMGAAVGVLVASRDIRVHALVSLGGMVHTGDFATRKFGELQPGKDFMWEIPECPLSQEFLDDMASIDTVLPLGAMVKVPWLLIHGTADTVVPASESEAMLEVAGGAVEMIAMDDVDHVFSGEAGPAMARIVSDWVRSLCEEDA
ncbi:MAG: alpha/beta hydrolase family protein [Planctomycetota bacterium]